MKTYIKIIAALFMFAAIPAWSQEKLPQADKNPAVEKFDGTDVVWRDALKAPFALEGFPFVKEGAPLRRIPDTIKPEDISGGVFSLAWHTAGGVVRFRTDSPVIVLKAALKTPKTNLGHMPSTGVSGFDVFADKDRYVKTVNPMHYRAEAPTPVVEKIYRGAKAMRDYTVYLPLYNGVNYLQIGVSPDAKFETPTPHKIKKPIVFYGSSITQGACASRTSNCYTAMLCRAVDAPMINLGFSGNAKGEPKMAELISGLDMSVFVYDYDHNAPDAVHLKKTHEPFFKIIRAAHPELPIIMISRFYGATDERTSAIRQTYENAVKNGDKKVWFIDGRDLVKDVDSSYITVDGCHPNDIGFYHMYKNTLPVLKEALGEK